MNASFFALVLAGLFLNNYLMVQFLGICPFLGLSNKMESAFGMGIAVTFVMAIASAITYGVYQLLILAGVEYLYNIAFILVIAGIVQIIEMVLKKFTPALYSAMGIYLPLITTNCAVLGVAVLNMGFLKADSAVQYTLLDCTLSGLFYGLGFMLAIVILAGLREKIGRAKIAKSFKGFPISLLAASCMALAFYVFSTFPQ